MMGPAVDTTARFSSYILRCRYVSIWCWFGVQCVTRARPTASFTNYQFISSPITFSNRERLQLIGLKSFHQYDDGRKIFQRQFTAHFSIYKVGINQFVIYSAKLMYVICGSPKLMYVICGSPLEVKAKG